MFVYSEIEHEVSDKLQFLKENKKNFMRKNYMRPTLRKLHHYNTLRHPLEEVNKIDNVSEKE